MHSLVRIDQRNRYVLFTDSEVNIATLPREAEVKLVRGSGPTAIAASANGHRSAADVWKMSRAMSDREFDLLFFPTIYSYVPIFARAKKIVMIHDVIPEKYPALTVPRSANRFFWKTKVMIGRWQADAIATVSDHDQAYICEVWLAELPSNCDDRKPVTDDPG
jgi:hypothetical protein